MADLKSRPAPSSAHAGGIFIALGVVGGIIAGWRPAK